MTSLANDYCSTILEKSNNEMELNSVSDDSFELLSQELLSYDEFIISNDDQFNLSTSPLSPSLGMGLFSNSSKSTFTTSSPKTLYQSPKANLFNVPSPTFNTQMNKFSIPPPLSNNNSVKINIPPPITSSSVKINVPPPITRPLGIIIPQTFK